MESLHEYTDELIPFYAHRAKPGPVRRLDAKFNFRGKLFLQWRPPAGSRVMHYRIERTPNGQDYETLAETTGNWFCLADVPLHEGWFYQVVAVNARGVGRAKCVWFFQRIGNGKSRLEFVPVIPGLCVNICNLVWL